MDQDLQWLEACQPPPTTIKKKQSLKKAKFKKKPDSRKNLFFFAPAARNHIRGINIKIAALYTPYVSSAQSGGFLITKKSPRTKLFRKYPTFREWEMRHRRNRKYRFYWMLFFRAPAGDFFGQWIIRPPIPYASRLKTGRLLNNTS